MEPGPAALPPERPLDRGPVGDAAGRPGARQRATGAYARAVVVVAAATVAAIAAQRLLHVPDVEMLFLLGVTVVAVTSARGPSIFAAVLSVLAYDFFFVAPSFTLAVEDVRYLLTFVMMLGIGVVISTLAVRLREERQAAVDREQRTAALYAVSRSLGAALGPGDVAAVLADAVRDVLAAPAVLLARRGPDDLAPVDGATSPAREELEVARWALLHGSAAGSGTGTFGEAPVLCVPLRPVVEVLAVLLVRAGAPLPPGGREFVEALCRQGALALERIRLGDEARQASLRAEAEALRSALLSAVSHDLRTPLAAITGAATALRDGAALDAATRGELVDAICEESERLERLVRNLLDMTRLESGAAQPRREWVPASEVVGGALTRLERRLEGRAVLTAIPEDLPLLAVDPVLVEQLLVNVLENATKYTPPGSPIDVSAARDDGAVVLQIADRGPGIPQGAEERIFERFRRGEHPGVGGAGLGLAIARAIAHAHGGAIEAAARDGGGAVFRIRLPAGEPPPGARPAEVAP